MRCPDDAHLLQVETSGKVTFAVCRHCDGIWFSREAIEGRDRVSLSEPVSVLRKNDNPEQARSCPQCGFRLDKEKVEEIVIDVCPKCGGVWLDPGEYRAARRRSVRMRLERDVASLKPKRSKVGKAFEWVLDFIGETFVEKRR